MDSFGAYEVLVRVHEKMLNAYLVGLVNDRELAEDIAEEAFVKAYESLDELRDKAKFPAWLRAIARNLAMSELKRRNLLVPLDPDTLAGMEDVFSGLDVRVEDGSWEERFARLEKCFGELPEKLRAACSRHYMDDMKVAEIAGELSVSVQTVLKRLERAREAIRKCVERQLGLAEA